MTQPDKATCEACQEEAEETRRKDKRYAREMAHTLPPAACEGCERSHGLMAENATAWRVFESEMSQLRLGADNEVLGIDHAAVWMRLSRERLWERELVTFGKVRVCEAEFVKVMGERRKESEKRREQEREREKRKKKNSPGMQRGFRRRR